MTLSVKNRTAKMALRLAALAGMTAGLSACYTDFGLGYASDGYGSNNYDCDPYSPFDTYYGCDYGYGFSNIGYGGGWYDNFYYPGYGIFLFDNYGQRYNMRDNHRRYWGGQRFNWQREHYRGNRPNIGNQGGGYYPGGTRPDGGHHDWSGDGRRDGDHDGRRGDGRRDGHGDGRRDGPRNGSGNAPAGAIGTPSVSNPEPGRGEGYGRGGRGRNTGGFGRGSGAGTNAVGAPVPQTGGEPDMRDGVMGSREEARFERRENYTPQPRQTPQPIPQQAAPQNYGQPQQRSQPAPERRTARPEAREQRRGRGVDRGVDNTVEE